MSENGGVDLVHSDDQLVLDRSIRLFTFLRALTELRIKVVRTLDSYEKVLWLSDIPRERGCFCAAWNATDGEEKSNVWLEIIKPNLKAAPQPPEILEAWLDAKEVADSSIEFPSLKERIILSTHDSTNEDEDIEPKTIFQELEDVPEVKTIWERYVERQWWPWAEEDRKIQLIQKVYTDLFSIYQKQQRLGESYEIVLGLGYLTWRTAKGHEIRRHIITAQVNLAFDASRGVITLGPSADGAKPMLEQDMLDPEECPDATEQNAIEKQISEMADSLWDGVQLQAILKGWTYAVSPRARFVDNLMPQSEVYLDPTVHMAPAVILRKRTERSLIRIIKEIIDQLRDSQIVPLGIKRLVTIIDDHLGDASSGDIMGSSDKKLSISSEEIYFPLPANDEQREIAQKLAGRQGVLVQGPPGTGKSHTIANLVCHLLATGHRVLVTSHTPRALKVLRDKFPKEISDLCVMLLGNDHTALQSLEDSVRGITDRYNTWNPSNNQLRINKIEAQLDEARKEEARILQDLRAIRENETYQHHLSFGNYRGTAQHIAQRIRAEEKKHSWFTGMPSDGHESPLTNAEAIELIILLREIDSSQQRELEQDFIDPDSLITPSEFSVQVKSEANAQVRYEETDDHQAYPGYKVLLSIKCELRDKLLADLNELDKEYDAFAHHLQPWAKEAATQVLAGQYRTWTKLHDVTGKNLETIEGLVREVSECQISGLGEKELSIVKSHAKALLKHLESGGGLGFGPFRAKEVKDGIYLVREVFVDGTPCNRLEPIQTLLKWITIVEHLKALERNWEKYAIPPSGPFISQVAEYQDLLEVLERALQLRDKVKSLKELTLKIQGLTEPMWHDQKSLAALKEAIKAVAIEEEFQEARKPLDYFENYLHQRIIDADPHPLIKQLFEIVKARDEQRYEKTYKELCSLQKSREQLNRRNDRLNRLRDVNLKLANELEESFTNSIWDERFADFEGAWNWARANSWLKKISDPRAQEQLIYSLERCRRTILELLKFLAEARAWGYCFSRLTEHERQHLVAWMKAMRRIGKGTGKYADMHRRAARESMEECRSAIPAWIMPIYRVAESIRPGLDVFDVVIVDEASQSGPEAIFLLYIAKKIVVVGDDKQISPESVGIRRQDVELLRQRYIPDIPHSDDLNVDNSFFDQAEIRYGGRIRLREHFRCMPEIIQFSNNLCYRSEPLIPLKQYGSDRLAPVIATRHVQDGYLKGERSNIINPPEAQAIVDQIKKCCEDPTYNGKTMGVISLLGSYQAQYIEVLILKQLGPEEMERRQLICGDAYAFQGDERDIMFLSMVSAVSENRRIGTLTRDKDVRRFNVAVSRARDQMYLFHSVTLNDLNPACLRYRLLEYCQNPKVEALVLEGINIDKLRIDVKVADRNSSAPPLPFDSWFEVDVFLEIVDRGYRVIPQLETAGYYIDLMIEGMRGRLAVECDGDKWHGADRYEEDMARQRMLERCGLTFWRIRGSAYYRDPESALEGLWIKLNQLKIYPSGKDFDEHAPFSPSADVSAFTPHTFEGIPEIMKPESHQLSFYHGDEIIEGKSDIGSADLSSLSDVELDAEFGDEKYAPSENLSRLTEPDRHIGSDRSTPHVQNLDRGDGDFNCEEMIIPYKAWDKRPLPNPRKASVEEVMSGLIEIIDAEGPILSNRLYRLYIEACGEKRIDIMINVAFTRAVDRAIKRGLAEQNLEYTGDNNDKKQVFLIPNTPKVLLRTRGDRMFSEIPSAEIAKLMNCLLAEKNSISGDELIRAVLKHYEMKQVSPSTKDVLRSIKDHCIEIF